MSSAQPRQVGAAAGRLLALLAAVLGLLAMHSLASTHHATAAVPAAPTAVAESLHAGQDAAAAHAEGAVATIHAGLTGMGVPCDDACATDLSVLCVAVLAAGVAAVVATAARRCRLPVVVRADVRARAPTASRCLSRVDPVAELCVNRT